MKPNFSKTYGPPRLNIVYTYLELDELEWYEVLTRQINKLQVERHKLIQKAHSRKDAQRRKQRMKDKQCGNH